MITNYKQFLESEQIGGKWDIVFEFDEKKKLF